MTMSATCGEIPSLSASASAIGCKKLLFCPPGRPLSLALPETVVCEIVQADPVVKGQTAAASYKPAILDNGVRVMVPPHIGVGTRIVVNTADSSYVERAKD